MKHETNRLRALSLAAVACAALCASLFLTGCGSMPTYAKSFPDEQIRTPENSSICYGIYAWSAPFTEIEFAQMNTDFPPCNLKAMYYSIMWVTKPVVAGERYKLINASGPDIKMFYRLDGTSELDFTVPSEPGLHYMGAVGAYADMYNKDRVKMELTSLDIALKMYAGTVWEPVIQKRIEELKNAK